jgi:hypothetical protein
LKSKIAFHIERSNYFKVLGGVIDELMRRGHQVILFYAGSCEGRLDKGIAAPTAASFPRFSYGTPIPIAYPDIDMLGDLIASRADVLVLHQGYHGSSQEYAEAVRGKGVPAQYQRARRHGVPIVTIASHFFDHCLWPIDAFDYFDKICILSRHAAECHKRILLNTFKGTSDDESRYSQQIDLAYQAKVIETGSALFDMFLRVKKGRSTAAGDIVLFAPKIDGHPYMQVVLREHSRFGAFALSLVRFKGAYGIRALVEPRFSAFVKALASRCLRDRRNFVVKSRPKHGRTHDALYRSQANRYVVGNEDSFYPDFTSAEIFENAALSLHIRTFSVMEAVVAGTYAINIEIPVADEKDGFDALTCEYVRQVRTPHPDTLFNFDGCVRNVMWREVRDCLNLQPIPAIDPIRRREYLARFCGIEDENISASSRVSDVIENLLIYGG